MVKRRKTGGRDFKRGNPGKKKGAKDKVPRSFKASIRVLCEQLATDDPDLIRRALVKGLKAAAPKSFQYLQMFAHYQDGKPAETVNMRPDLSGLNEQELRIWEQLMQKAHAGTNAR